MREKEKSRSWKFVVLACVMTIAVACPALAAPPDSGSAAPAAGTKHPASKPGKVPPPKGTGGPHAKGGPGTPPAAPYGVPTGFIERHAERLGLSDETVKQIRDVVEKSRTENERIRKQVDEAQRELRTLLAQDLPDEKAVMAQADNITRLVGEQRKNQLRSAIKVRTMLTPQQRAELDKLRKEQPPPRRVGPGAPPPAHPKKPAFGTGGPQGKKPPAKPAPTPPAVE
jgi:Spy/CpxP family protein refolding chaperone